MSIDREKYFDADEIKRLKENTAGWAALDLQKGRLQGPKSWMVVDVALSTGLRVSEIAALKIEDINFKRGSIKVQRLKRKRKTIESLALSEKLMEHIKSYIDDRVSGPLIISNKGGALSRWGLRDCWKAACKRAGLPVVSIHCARHSVAVALLKETGNLRLVQKFLGHSSPVTTSVYADVAFEDIQAAINAVNQ